MFGIDFYPTPANVIEIMTRGEDLSTTILEPSAGKGDIVKFCQERGATVIACEIDENLRAILEKLCPIISEDFLTVSAEQISHVKIIIMNPPFNSQEKHILHAWNIAPPGCKIISLCNASYLKERYHEDRELPIIIKNNGTAEELGDVFKESERKTLVNTGLIRIQKPTTDYNTEFEGFYMEEEEETGSEPGLMPYNVIRDIVSRYIEAVKIFDQQLETATQLNTAVSLFSGLNLGFTVTKDQKPYQRTEFKKDLQRCAWVYILNKLDLKKYATENLKQDINKFIEEQYKVPFTMRNIYHMLQIIVSTTSQRMDKAIIEVFERLTKYHEENREGVAGWKTNSHYLLTKKFILPWITEADFRGGARFRTYNTNFQYIEDLEKVLCWLLNMDYNSVTLYHSSDTFKWGEWNGGHSFFNVKLFKKGTAHFEFKSEEIWGKFNAAVGRIKGYPLYEAKKQTQYQDKQTGKAEAKPRQYSKEGQILFEFSI